MATTKWIAGFGALAMASAIACSGERAPVAPAITAAPQLAAAQPPAADWEALAQPAGTQVVSEATSILRTQPLAENITVSAAIGPAGGRIEIPAAGLRVEVPRLAVRQTTTFTVTALAGDMVAYEFGPHGTRFPVPLLVTQDTRGTNAAALPSFTVLDAGYFLGEQMLDRQTKRARLAEVLPTFAVKVDSSIGFLVQHFSGYIVTWRGSPRESRN